MGLNQHKLDAHVEQSEISDVCRGLAQQVLASQALAVDSNSLSVQSWRYEQKEVPPLLILYSIPVKASQPFEPIRVADSRCEKHSQQHDCEPWSTVKSHV